MYVEVDDDGDEVKLRLNIVFVFTATVLVTAKWLSYMHHTCVDTTFSRYMHVRRQCIYLYRSCMHVSTYVTVQNALIHIRINSRLADLGIHASKFMAHIDSFFLGQTWLTLYH